jgi:hypothetical protein
MKMQSLKLPKIVGVTPPILEGTVILPANKFINWGLTAIAPSTISNKISSEGTVAASSII